MTPRSRMPAQPLGFSAEPNVTPMIDVLLVLLVTFMVALPMERQVMTSQLPPDDTGSATHVAAIVLEVSPGARYALNGRTIPAPLLATELKAVYRGRPDRTLIVKGDRSATYQEVVTAMDIARGAGVTVVGIDTRRP
jgi:biopolymer transport protein TolR